MVTTGFRLKLEFLLFTSSYLILITELERFLDFPRYCGYSNGMQINGSNCLAELEGSVGFHVGFIVDFSCFMGSLEVFQSLVIKLLGNIITKIGIKMTWFPSTVPNK